MSLRVTDPSGVAWVVSREWFGLPRWARWRSELESLPPDAPVPDGDVDALPALALVVLAVVVFLLLLGLLLPLLVFLVGLVAAVVALLARLAGVSAWIVRAESADRELSWSVRGLFRSRRRMHEVAGALARGDEASLRDAA